MKSLFSFLALIVLNSSAYATASPAPTPAPTPAPQATIAEYLKGKPTTYQVRYSEETVDGSTTSTTVECHEGKLADDIIVRDPVKFGFVGYLEFRRGPLQANIAVDSRIKNGRQGAVDLSAHFWPNIRPGIGYPIGTTLGDGLEKLDQRLVLAANVLENGMAYQDQWAHRAVKELSVSINLNPIAQYDCAYWLSHPN